MWEGLVVSKKISSNIVNRLIKHSALMALQASTGLHQAPML